MPTSATKPNGKLNIERIIKPIILQTPLKPGQLKNKRKKNIWLTLTYNSSFRDRPYFFFIIKTSNSEHITLSRTPFLITWNRSTPVINIVLDTVIIIARHWSVCVYWSEYTPCGTPSLARCVQGLQSGGGVGGGFTCQISVRWGRGSRPHPWCVTWRAGSGPRAARSRTGSSRPSGCLMTPCSSLNSHLAIHEKRLKLLVNWCFNNLNA